MRIAGANPTINLTLYGLDGAAATLPPDSRLWIAQDSARGLSPFRRLHPKSGSWVNCLR
jgi:hypothetical protein